MTHGHSPIVYLAKLGGKWLAAGAVAFALFNPMTWGAGLAIGDAVTGQDWGAWFFGHNLPRYQGPPLKPVSGICQLHINGHVFVVATDCSRVVFPGPKKDA